MNLKRQGYFKEMPHGEDTDPSIIPYINKADSSEITNICAYLDSGIPLITCCGVSFDVIKPENGISGTPTVFSDGKWVWPGDLSYYVKNYALALDSAFVEDMREKGWHIDLSESDIDFKSITIDGKRLFDE